MRRRGGMVIGVLVGVLALAAAGCGGANDSGDGNASAATAAPTTTSAPSTTTAAAGGGGENEVQLVATDFKFDKTSLEVKAGSQVKVELRNHGQAEHNFTFAEGKADQDVEAGEDATVTFTAPAAGSYQFHCKYHPTLMKGAITVT